MDYAVEHIQIPVQLTEQDTDMEDFSINLKTLAKTATKIKLLAELNDLETKLVGIHSYRN